MVNLIRKLIIVTVLFSFGVFHPAIRAGWFGPSNYDECVLAKIKDAANTAAVIAIYQSCNRLFPPIIGLLPKIAQENVLLSSAKFNGGFIELIIENNNLDWALDSLQVIFFDIPGKPSSVKVFSSNEILNEGTSGNMFEITDNIPGGKSIRVIFERDKYKAHGVMLIRKSLKGHRQ